jgi:hypothetical protein
MKILLDERLPRKLRNSFGAPHEVWNVRDKGWLGRKNGVLLKSLIEDGFEVFITSDRNLQYEQNIVRLSNTIFVLCAKDNRLKTLQELIPKVIEKTEPGELKL